MRPKLVQLAQDAQAEQLGVPESIRIEAPSAPLALSLIEHLDGFHSEVVPADSERFEVSVEVDGRRRSRPRAARQPRSRVGRWLESSGLDLVEVQLNGRSYGFERRDRTKIPPQR